MVVYDASKVALCPAIKKLSHAHAGETWGTVGSRKFFCMDNGWIKLHRRLLENPVVMKDADHLAIWTWLLLNVTHNGVDVIFKGKRITLLAGQMTVGRRQIAEELKISESKVHRVLSWFESEQQIEQQTSSQCRLITVKKWSTFQSSEQQSEQQVNNKRTTSEQQVNTKQECNNEKNERMKEPEPNIATPAAVADEEDKAAIKQIFDAFYTQLNPDINWGNKTQRAAAAHLVKAYGLEKVLRTIDYLVSIREEQFAPVITTPYQLKEKMAQLTAYYNKNTAKPKSTMAIIS